MAEEMESGAELPSIEPPPIERPVMEVDIACVGFGPAMGGFLTTLSRGLVDEDGVAIADSAAVTGMPPQVICCERADDIGFGVSGVVTRARSIRASFPGLDPSEVPMSAPVFAEKLVYLLDPLGASRRPLALRAADAALKLLKPILPLRHDALEIPWAPEFLHKGDGFVLSLGQFNQWVGSQLMVEGNVQIWPGSPVAEPLMDGKRVKGIRLMDQGVDKQGKPEAYFMAGMDIHAALTVVADGPVGAIGQQLDEAMGLPEGHHQHEWAVGMKMVIDLPDNVDLEAGTVFHTLGYPEPEIFGFLYVHPGHVASVGIFVPSWFDSPVRTSYRYLQHFIMHPYLWRFLKGGRLRSWGAKSLQESGIRGEPFLALDGCARIGEGSGSTNVLTNSGVDEAWFTGTLLAEGVLELLKSGRPFSRKNLDEVYTARRRASWLEPELRMGEHARDGFQRGFLTGMAGMALTGLTKGRLNLTLKVRKTHEQIGSMEKFYRGRLNLSEIDTIQETCRKENKPLHDELMTRCGWPEIPLDGQLLVSLQDALLTGGKVQAPAGFKDHVTFRNAEICRQCGSRTCVEICSGEAITSGADGLPSFDREKCVHCGACLWNCTQVDEMGRTNLIFRAGAGGLHSAEN
jgi:electron-transferring-flavoprotein dehydrogenase